MPLIPFVRFTTQTSDTAAKEARRVEEGTTYRDVLEEELLVNPAKFSVLVNGNGIEDLDATVKEGDEIRLLPRNYSSGCVH